MDTTVESPQDLRERLGRYKFYHRIDLGHGVVTPGLKLLVPQQQMVLRQLRKIDFKGKRVLDIGCRDGLLSLEAEKLGAAEVIGIDNDLSRGATEVVLPHLKSKVQMHEMNLMDLTPATFGKFDVIIFSGVLYHLRYPFYALRLIRELLNDGGVMLLETAIWHVWERHAMLYCPVEKESPYEITCVTFYNVKGMIDTLRSLGYDTVCADRLFTRQIFRTPGATWKFKVGAVVNFVQRWCPNLVHLLMRRFFIDRAVFHCKLDLSKTGAFETEYWERRHQTHTVHAKRAD